MAAAKLKASLYLRTLPPTRVRQSPFGVSVTESAAIVTNDGDAHSVAWANSVPSVSFVGIARSLDDRNET